MQVQVQVQVQTAKEMKVQGEVMVSTKPQATEMTARGKEQCEWTRHTLSQRADPGNSLIISSVLVLRGTILNLIMIY